MCADRPSFYLGLDREPYYPSMPIGLRHSIPFARSGQATCPENLIRSSFQLLCFVAQTRPASCHAVPRPTDIFPVKCRMRRCPQKQIHQPGDRSEPFSPSSMGAEPPRFRPW